MSFKSLPPPPPDFDESLSGSLKQLLSSADVSLDPRKTFTFSPMAIQRRVAKATGLNIVAEGMVPGTLSAFWPDRHTAIRGSMVHLTALHMLETLSAESLDPHLAQTTWEGHGGETCLSLRTTNQDMWRAGRLPKAFTDWMDSMIWPQVPTSEQVAKGTRSFEISVPVVLEEWTKRLAGLNDLQFRYGLLECYGDPTTPLGAARQAFLQRLCEQAREELRTNPSAGLPHLEAMAAPPGSGVGASG